MQPYKICCLTYKSLDSLVKETLRELVDPETEIIIVEGKHEDIIQGLVAAETAGAEVVIGGGANLRIAREVCSVPVIEYRMTTYDYLTAINKAIILGGDIAICTYKYPANSALIEHVRQTGVNCVNIIYDSTAELESKMLANSGHVFVGAANCVDIADKLGFKSVLIYSGQTAVLDALSEAKFLAKEHRQRREHSKFAQAVVENSTNGLVLVDTRGIVFDFNNAAEQVFNKSVVQVKGRAAAEIIAECGISDFLCEETVEKTVVLKIDGRDVLCKWMRLTGKCEGLIGYLGIFTVMSDILKAQMDYQEKARREQKEKGFMAKMRFNNIVGTSPAVQAAKDEAHLFAASDATVLIHGETGVGKELFAQSIHNAGKRKNQPFIAINCAALPENLLETEMFGYDEGAFTGGRRGGKKGLFELADKGSIFLDEIGELSPKLQTRLLRVLQEREIMHVGGDRVIPVDVRVISATNNNLEALDAETFRRDLYYRLSVLELYIPPLRERGDDAVMLFTYFFRQKRSLTLRQENFPPEISRIITEYSWPGNIRELQNVCERFALHLENSQEQTAKFLRRCMVRSIGEERLLKNILARFAQTSTPAASLTPLLQEIFGYNKKQAGEKLGLSRTTVWRLGRGDAGGKPFL